MKNHSDEFLHNPTDDLLWQESCYLAWHDPKAGIAGIHRIGLEVNSNVANYFCGIMTDEGVHYRLVSVNESCLHGGVGADLMAAGPQSVKLGARPVLSCKTDELDLKLKVEDFYAPSLALQEGDGGYQDTLLASNHYEGTARFTGRVELDGRSYEVNGLGFRDHSWGPRDWNALLSFRTCIGSTGSNLSWSALVMHVTGKPVMTKGYVERNGKIITAKEIDVLCFIEGDGLTHRGGVCRMNLEDGTSLLIDAETDKGTILHCPNVYSMEGICRININGEKMDEAFCLLEMANNAHMGSREPEVALRASLKPGLSRLSG